jgi:hypothetical protein
MEQNFTSIIFGMTIYFVLFSQLSQNNYFTAHGDSEHGCKLRFEGSDSVGRTLRWPSPNNRQNCMTKRNRADLQDNSPLNFS